MKHLLTLTLLFSLLISCQKNESKTPAKAPKTAVTAADKDKTEIDKLVKGMYRWHKKRQSLLHEFRCLVKDTVVVGLDPISHSLYLKSLHDSGFFSGEFRGNMTRIFKKQDELVRSKKVEWYTTEMGPFDSGANPWCNCQDELSYDEITLHFEKIFATCENRIHAIFLFLNTLELIQGKYINIIMGKGMNNFTLEFNESRQEEEAI